VFVVVVRSTTHLVELGLPTADDDDDNDDDRGIVDRGIVDRVGEDDDNDDGRIALVGWMTLRLLLLRRRGDTDARLVVELVTLTLPVLVRRLVRLEGLQLGLRARAADVNVSASARRSNMEVGRRLLLLLLLLLLLGSLEDEDDGDDNGGLVEVCFCVLVPLIGGRALLLIGFVLSFDN